MLYARIGVAYCPTHNEPINAQTNRQIVEQIMNYEEGSKIIILSPIARLKKGTFKDTFEKLLKDGFIRVRVDGEMKLIEEVEELDKNKKHDIDIVVDRLVIKKDIKTRVYDSIETALKWSNGLDVVSNNLVGIL